MSKKSDIELVKAAQSGDTSAYNDLVRRHQAGMKLEMTRYLNNVHDAEDVTQDAFLRAYLKLSSLKAPYNFGGWVRQIARNMARNLLTRGPRFVALEQQHTLDESDSALEQSNNYLPDQVEQTVLALSRLSSRLRETARLSYLSNYSHRQIAERLHIPVGTVKRRLWEGRSQIRKEVINMSRKGRNTELLMTVPDIRIHELPEEQMEIKVKGPGLYFGTLLQVGHQEVCRFFDYPGGILTQTVQTHVIRKVNILGRECFEVLIEHSDCEPPEPNLVDYFQVTDQDINWIMRVTSDVCYPQARFMKENEEVFPVSYSCQDKKTTVPVLWISQSETGNMGSAWQCSGPGRTVHQLKASIRQTVVRFCIAATLGKKLQFPGIMITQSLRMNPEEFFVVRIIACGMIPFLLNPEISR